MPLLTALVLSYGLFADSATVTRDVQALAGILPANAAEIVADQLEAMTQASGAKTGLALLVSLAIAVFGASKAAGAIMTALNIVYEAKEGRGLVLADPGLAAGDGRRVVRARARARHHLGPDLPRKPAARPRRR